MRVYSLKDRITVKIDELEFKLAPLSYKQKIEIQNLLVSNKATEGFFKALKYAIKGVKGLEDVDGNEYKLAFDENGLNDECIEDIMNLEISPKIQVACGHLVNGIPKQIINPNTNKPLEGVKILTDNEDKKKGKQ